MNTQFFMGWLRTTWLAGLLIAGTTGRGLAAIPDDLLIFHSEPQAFPLTPPQQTASVVVDPADWPGVVRVAGDLVQDIHRVSDHKTELVISRQPQGEQLIVVGTLGKSALIDALVQTGKLSASELTNRWEAYTIATLVAPWPGVKQALVIAGSDKRGTIYGVYELSSQMGVSPWYYWADVLPQAHPVIYCRPGSYHQGEPSVKYRGIFLNDEAPDLTGWVREKFGEVPGHPGVANYGPGFYTNLFEVILRCQGNFLWPAMWNNAFNEDDTNNPALADRYGIVMGTSHQEPMLRAQKEWDRRLGRTYGNWNYNLTNQQPVLQQFWREGVRRNKPYESIVTLGLRAENDAGTPIGKELTEKIVEVQRRILAEEINADLTQVPQLWCLYKEVQGFYNEGLRVPDDVTLLWAEDNWGNVRRLPTAAERNRPGGAGVYYHFDYHGGPRSYQWLNTTALPKIWDQMSLAKQYGADRIWIVNVGHFKGYELPMEFFLNFGRDTARWTAADLHAYTVRWATRQFGRDEAEEIAGILERLAKYNARRKPELVDAHSYSLVHHQEFTRVVHEYDELVQQAQKIAGQLPPASRPAFYELVQFPVQATAQLHALYLAAARNALYAAQGRAEAADFASATRQLFAAETNLMADFNTRFLDGRWNHFMDQSVLGYKSWRDPEHNNLSAVKLVEPAVPAGAGFGVAAEGNALAATNGSLTLPECDSLNDQTLWVDVFNCGQAAFDYSVAAAPWVKLSERAGRVEKSVRLLVAIDWQQLPLGVTNSHLVIQGAGGSVSVAFAARHWDKAALGDKSGYVEGQGYVSIEPTHFVSNHAVGECAWQVLPDYGRTLGGMRACTPAHIASLQPGADAPFLEYSIYLTEAGPVQIHVVTSPVLNFMADRGIHYGVSLDLEKPQVVTLVPAGYTAGNGNADWEAAVIANARTGKTSHTSAAPGWHTLRLWLMDPGVVVQKIMVDAGGLPNTLLGPPESYRLP